MVDVIDIIQIIAVGGITILASLLTTWINNRSAERRMRIELTYQRRNDALNKLFEVANKDYKSFDDLERELLSCMHGSLQSLYLPEKIVKGIYRHYALSEREKRKIHEVDRIAVLKNVIKNLISEYIRDIEK
jgi:hypothetical protein